MFTTHYPATSCNQSNGVRHNSWATTGAEGKLKEGYKWLISDRTHRVALRGTVIADYDYGAATPASDPVKVRHVVKAHVSLLNAPGSQFGWVAKFEAEGDFARANEQYAQVGILLKPTIVEDVAWPNGKDGTLDLTNGLDVASNTGLTAQEKALFTLRTKDKTDDIEVYYVNKFIGSDASGLSVCASSNPPPEYVDSVMIKGIGRLDKPFTLAHEIGHVLTNVLDNNGHFVGKPRLINLMNAGTSGSDHIQATKRLVTDQENLILRQRPMLLSAPG